MSKHYCLALAAALVTLSACVSGPSMPPVKEDPAPRLTPLNADTKASFTCAGALPAVHRQICADDTLALQDKELVSGLRVRLQQLDLPGALILEANQRQWSLSRATHCGLGEETGTGVTPDPQAIACLQAMYRKRAAQLAAWPSHQSKVQTEAHAWSSYAEFRVAQGAGQGLCTTVGNALNQSVANDGTVNIAKLAGAELKAGSHASANRIQQGGYSVSVELYEPGLHAGYQQRARGLTVNGQVVLDDRTLPRWIAEQPNYGGRAHASSSQTGDYGSIDVFTYKGEMLALINETWGFYSPAARGESAYAGLYRVSDGVTPLCLYQTYLTPPRTNTLRGLPTYSALVEELVRLSGDPLRGYSQQERQDLHQRWQERQWTLLNLPLLGVDQLQRNGREAAVRSRQDAALELLFQWSERNVGNKHLYRQVMPMLLPAYRELVSMFSDQGLNAAEAISAADLLFHESFARAMENLSAPTQPPTMPAAPFASYTPRYAIAPEAGALEQQRQFATLHSVLLNGAPLPVIKDFIDYETRAAGADRGVGADGDTALMAAVESPDAVRLLLQQGFDVNSHNQWGKTPLMSAAQISQPESAKLLLDAGANIYAQTETKTDVGVGGPDRREASSTPRTALLIAAGAADARMIDRLIEAGAVRQAWKGYDQEVCRELERNARLTPGERDRYQSSALCASSYAPLPLAAQKPVDIRAGDEVVIRDDGTTYSVHLQTRPAMTLFGRQLEVAPDQLLGKVRRMAVNVAIAAHRKSGGRIDGPLNLVFDNLAQNTPQRLYTRVSYPVLGSTANVAGYQADSYPAQQVLSVEYIADKHIPANVWRALYSAAYTQGFEPAGAGYVVITNRGVPRVDYQLVVTDIYKEQ